MISNKLNQLIEIIQNTSRETMILMSRMVIAKDMPQKSKEVYLFHIDKLINKHSKPIIISNRKVPQNATIKGLPCVLLIVATDEPVNAQVAYMVSNDVDKREYCSLNEWKEFSKLK